MEENLLALPTPSTVSSPLQSALSLPVQAFPSSQPGEVAAQLTRYR